jgi:hypothetical protein
MRYVKRGFMENHLERDHPSALSLTVSAPYCPACDARFASKRLLIDHIMDIHVLAHISPSPARAVSARVRSVAPSPARDAATEQGECANIVDKEGITGDDMFAMNTSDFPTSPIPYLNVPTNFSYQQPADTTAYTHPIARRFLPLTPMAIHLQANIQGNASQHHDSDQPGEPEHSQWRQQYSHDDILGRRSHLRWRLGESRSLEGYGL